MSDPATWKQSAKPKPKLKPPAWPFWQEWKFQRSASTMSQPNFENEALLVSALGGPIAGIDEAGRGPLAGPVVAAAVLFDAKVIRSGLAGDLRGLNDSKALRENVREELHDRICGAFEVGVGVAETERIDDMNILNATLWAMGAAVRALPRQPAAALVDGNRAPDLGLPTETVVKGDARCISIAAASIVAKVTRDRLMRELGRRYPEYGFEAHKGYGTRAHLAAIDRFGVLDEHRRSFRPVRLALGWED